QAFGASVALLLSCGPEAVSRRILDRAEAVREVARSSGWSVCGSSRPQDLSGIVSLEEPGGDPNRDVSPLRRRGVAGACRPGRVGFSPHVNNNEEDLGRLREGLAGF